MNSHHKNIVRYVITYDIKDQARRYWNGRYFSEIKADAIKFGTRNQAKDAFDTATNGQDSEFIHIRRITL